MKTHFPILKIDIDDLISKDYYPLVYIPKSIVDYVKANKYSNPSEFQVKELFKEFKPAEPFEPIKPLAEPIPTFVYEDVVIKKIDFFDLFLTFISKSFLIWLGVLVLSLVFGKLLSNLLNPFLYLIIPFTIALLLTINYSKNSIYGKIEKRKRPLTKSEIDEIINQNNLDESQYQRELKSYKEKHEIFQSKYKLFIEKYSVEYLLYNYRNLLKSYPPRRTKDIVKKGSSENYFLEYLHRYFGDSILIDTAIPAHNSSFYPDFVYESKKFNYFIDIEIDEKYDNATKRPIHYVGSDDNRNNFFLEKNWFIIRFAESQVKTYPDECCNFIKDFINRIDNPHISIDVRRPSVSNIRRWTYEEVYLDVLGDNRY